MTAKTVFEGDLLPCPFCGGAPVKFFDDGAQLDGTCACSDVGGSEDGCPGAALLAVTYKKWNTRAELVPDEAINSKYAISMGDDYARGYRRGYDCVKGICDILGIRPQDQNEQTARMAIEKLKAEISHLEADARKLRGLFADKQTGLSHDQ